MSASIREQQLAVRRGRRSQTAGRALWHQGVSTFLTSRTNHIPQIWIFFIHCGEFFNTWLTAGTA